MISIQYDWVMIGLTYHPGGVLLSLSLSLCHIVVFHLETTIDERLEGFLFLKSFIKCWLMSWIFFFQQHPAKMWHVGVADQPVGFVSMRAGSGDELVCAPVGGGSTNRDHTGPKVCISWYTMRFRHDRNTYKQDFLTRSRGYSTKL